MPSQASLWSEEINAHNLFAKAWPRGCAFAERMCALVCPHAPLLAESRAAAAAAAGYG